MRKGVGVFSWQGFLGALAMLLFVVVAGWVQGGPLIFAPGELSVRHVEGKTLQGVTSHVDFEGKCATCHALPLSKDVMKDRCLKCHTEEGNDMRSGQGFHGMLRSVTDCKACHTDHRGRDYPINILYRPNFPHEQTTFSLEEHERLGLRPFQCQDCHADDYLPFSQTRCADCHGERDPSFMTEHRQRFGDDCLACHDGTGKALRFDHSQTRLPLTGSHASLKCEECHVNQQFKGTPTDCYCYSCHKKDDKHKGAFGTQCEDCHRPTKWDEATFDHSRSNFPLTGAHVQVKCKDCHVNQQFKGTHCYSCHQGDDTHRGGLGTDCAKCHRTNAWTPSTFLHPRVREHLGGGEHFLTCERCHPRNDFSQYTCQGSGCHNSNNPTGEPGEGGGGD
ncbi:MAG: hypothetical protein GXP41_12735 [Chloroflexi bacterium]|nr:hypothetical protein [Chloroflexota bacterium]